MNSWGFSSVGRAPALHAGGQEFESPNLHHKIHDDVSYRVFYFAVKESNELLTFDVRADLRTY